jgi:multidrug resistance efflux pump
MSKRQCALGISVFVLFAAVAWLLPGTSAQVAGKKPKDPKEAKPAEAPTVKAEKKAFRVEVQVSGALEATENAEIVYAREPMLEGASLPLVIAKVAEHGAVVKKGDCVVAFEQIHMEQTLQNLHVDKKFLDAGIASASQEQRLLDRSVPLDLETAQRDKKHADEDLKYFLDVAKAQMLRGADFQLKSYAEFLDQAKEELRQLEKMYKANDLTEETEQIVLRRYRRYLERADYMYKEAKLDHEYSLKVELPRRELAVRQNVQKADIALEKASKTNPAQAAQKKQLMEKMQHERSKIESRIAKLEKDRAGLTLNAPIDGIVYHGKFVRGQWVGGVSDKLMPKATVQADEVFMTIVKPGALQARVSVDEKDAGDLKAGAAGKARFSFAPDLRLDAKVARVLPVPTGTGKFEVTLELMPGKNADVLRPGMACSVKFVPYSKKDALVVSASAVGDEDGRDVVYVPDGKGKHRTQEVAVGRTADGATEILNGLTEGDLILRDRPRAGAKKED